MNCFNLVLSQSVQICSVFVQETCPEEIRESKTCPGLSKTCPGGQVLVSPVAFVFCQKLCPLFFTASLNILLSFLIVFSSKFIFSQFYTSKTCPRRQVLVSRVAFFLFLIHSGSEIHFWARSRYDSVWLSEEAHKHVKQFKNAHNDMKF